MAKKRSRQQTGVVQAIPPKTVSAREMADAIKTVAHKLKMANIIDQANYSVLCDESRRVGQNADPDKWTLSIDRERPISFAQFQSKDGKIYIPRIVYVGIEVGRSEERYNVFNKLDIALEVDCLEQGVVARWHVDKANSTAKGVQDGPLFHLQYGGQLSDKSRRIHELSTPRWNHPPLDVLLLCEVVAANFYPEKWETFRDDPGWCKAVTTGENLCYPMYMNKMIDAVKKIEATAMGAMWASAWSLDA